MLAIVLIASGCSRRTETARRRMAVLPAAVLVPDPSSEWLAAALPIVLQQDLATSSALVVTFVPNASTAYQLLATDILRPMVEFSNGAYTVRVTLSDAATQEDSQHLAEQVASERDLLPALDRLARKIDRSRATSFSTHNFDALREFSLAVLSSDPPARNTHLQAAIQADPAFGLAYIASVENNGAARVPASAPVQSFTPMDRARWEALQAHRLAAPMARQMEAEQNVLNLAPNSVEALESLGTHRFASGQINQGEQLLRRAISLSPANQSLAANLAGHLVLAGRSPDALQILRPLANQNPSILPSVALVELLAGNTKAADATFARFLGLVPAGSSAALALQSQWDQYKAPASSQSAPATAPRLPEFTDPNGPAAFQALKRSLQRK